MSRAFLSNFSEFKKILLRTFHAVKVQVSLAGKKIMKYALFQIKVFGTSTSWTSSSVGQSFEHLIICETFRTFSRLV